MTVGPDGDPVWALSIQQPWAWLIVNGFKDIENRRWSTLKRGWFAVHAGKRVDLEGLDSLHRSGMLGRIILPSSFETGGLVGVSYLTRCVALSRSRWFVGPYGFELAQSRPTPFREMRGELGFFRVTR